jgi:hypothetical protein
MQHTTDMRNANRVWLENVKVRDCLEDLGIHETIVLKCILEKLMVGCGLD